MTFSKTKNPPKANLPVASSSLAGVPIDGAAIERRARDLEKSFASCISRLSKELSPRHVHRLRTTIRRIESLVVYRQVAYRHPRLTHKQQETLGHLESLRKRAGKVRNLDIQMELLGAIANGSAGHDRRELLEALSHKRQRRARRLQSIIARGAKPKFMTRVARLMESVSARPRASRRQDPLLSATAKLQRLAKDFADTRSFKPQKMHQVRLQLKEVRYLAELAAESPKQMQCISEIRAVQDSIGEWHDWSALAQAADKQFGDRINCPLLVEIQTLLAARYSAATSAVRQLLASHLPTAQQPGAQEIISRPKQPKPAAHSLARSA